MKKYFARANTATGLVNLMMNNLKNISSIYIIEGISKTAKSKLMGYIVKNLEERFSGIECIYSPFDIRMIDGVIIRDIKLAIVDGECISAVSGGKIINTDEFLNMKKLEVTRDYLEELNARAIAATEELYSTYNEGKNIHDAWEKLYIDNIDFDRLNSYSEGVINELIKDKNNKKGTEKYGRFFGASTPDGSVNYIDNITENLERRYFIKGRPGTGKSTFLKKLAAAAEQAGFDTETYYCSFDKNSLDMTLVPELGFCVFDSTPPHEMFPADKRDFVLDFYKESGLEGVDEKLEKQLAFVARKYRHRISEGIGYLRLANLYMEEREFYLERVTDFDAVARKADKIIRSIEG